MFKINDESPINTLLLDNTRFTTSMNKCAIIFRDEPLNQYIFVCYHCGETFSNSNNIIDHLNEIHFLSNNDVTSIDIKDEPSEPIVSGETVAEPSETFICKTEQQNNFTESIDDSNRIDPIYLKHDPDAVNTIKTKRHKSIAYNRSDDIKPKRYRKQNTGNEDIKPKRYRKQNSKNSSGAINDVKEEEEDASFNPIPKQAPYECYICKRILSTRESLIFHLGLLHNRKNLPRTMYQCELCQNTKAYASKYKYQNHLREHENKREHKCEICHLGYNTENSLKTHMLMHNEREFECDHCSYVSKTKSNLAAHIRNVHVKQKTFKCPICDKIFNYKNSYIYHQRHHSGEKPYQCYLCGVAYSTSSKLSKHMKGTHSTQTFKCEKCTKEFASESRLRTHLKTHTDQRLHTCSICGNSFKSRKTLRQHMFIHDEVKRFKCNYCDMKFAQTAGRRGHERLKHLSL